MRLWRRVFDQRSGDMSASYSCRSLLFGVSKILGICAKRSSFMRMHASHQQSKSC